MLTARSERLTERRRFKDWNDRAAGTSPGWWEKSSSHWLSVCRSHAFGPGQLKQADLGGGQDVPFEIAFANLAHSYLRDKAPKLLDFQVGFQLLEKNNDNTRAVGVFGFQLGSQWLFSPVFFLNGDLKGHELLYVKGQDSFVPLKENWLNYLLGRKPSVLGESVDKNLRDLGVQAPHFNQLARSPNKFASWARAVLPDLAYFATTDPNADPKFQKMAGLADFLREQGRDVVTYLIEKVAAAYPTVFRALDENYPGLLDELARQRPPAPSILDDAKEAGCGKGMKKRKVRRRKAASVLAEEARPDGPPRLRIYDLDEVGHNKAALDELDTPEREELLREGVVVKDDRFPDEVSHAYQIIEPTALTNPTETGIYDVLVRPASFEKCLVVVGPRSGSGKHPFCTVVRLDGDPAWLNTHPANVWVQGYGNREEYQKWFDALPEPKLSGDRFAKYILIGPAGDATVPFTVDEDYGEDGDGLSHTYGVWFSAHAENDQPEYLTGVDRRRGLMLCGSRDATVTINLRPGTTMRASRGDVFVPKNFKMLKVSKPETFYGPDEDVAADKGQADGSKRRPLIPGRLADVHLALIAETRPLRIYANGRMVTVNGSRSVSRKEAMVSLVRDHGFRKAAALSLLDQAERLRGKTFECRVKYAVGGPIGDMVRSAPGAPPMPEPSISSDYATGHGYPVMEESEFEVSIPGLAGDQEPRNRYDPNGPDPRSMAVAQQAAEHGQREVFDTAMLGSLLKVVRDDNMIDRYLGDMMRGLDRLGRVLFLFYWHSDSFEDRYGKQDMPELEDGLRNAFEAVGDIILALKRKSVEPFPDEGMDVDLGDVAN